MPLPNETLKEFFERTVDYWTKLTFELTKEDDEKTLRKEAFQPAEKRWNEMKPLIKKFEELEVQQQQEAKPSKKNEKRSGNNPKKEKPGVKKNEKEAKKK